MKDILKNFIEYAEANGRNWKKTSIYLYNAVAFIAAIGVFINIAKAESTKGILTSALTLPFIFLALFQGAIMRRIVKEERK